MKFLNLIICVLQIQITLRNIFIIELLQIYKKRRAVFSLARKRFD